MVLNIDVGESKGLHVIFDFHESHVVVEVAELSGGRLVEGGSLSSEDEDLALWETRNDEGTVVPSREIVGRSVQILPVFFLCVEDVAVVVLGNIGPSSIDQDLNSTWKQGG